MISILLLLEIGIVIQKQKRERLKNFYGKAYVDGLEVEVANWLVEPPGLLFIIRY